METSCTILDLYNAGISSFYKGGFLFFGGFLTRFTHMQEIYADHDSCRG